MPINWKNRAKKWEQEALVAEEVKLALHKSSAHLAFALEKEKALHRRTCEQNLSLNARLGRAIYALNGAVEVIAALNQAATAITFRMIANDLRPLNSDTDGCAKGITQKDEQA